MGAFLGCVRQHVREVAHVKGTVLLYCIPEARAD